MELLLRSWRVPSPFTQGDSFTNHSHPPLTWADLRLSSVASTMCLNLTQRASGLGKAVNRVKSSKIEELLRIEDDGDDEEAGTSGGAEKDANGDSFAMDEDERKEWRRTIRRVMNRVPDVEEEIDLIERRKKMQKLVDEYPLVVDEDDPDWPEDSDGWGFSLSQFFNKITIKNVKKDDDDENYDSENEIEWQDDNYIRPIKDITTAEWEEAVHKDISPLVVLVHNRYKRYAYLLVYKWSSCLKKFLDAFRSKENEKCQNELVKAVEIIWNCRLPSPRCVAVDANQEFDLVSALRVSVFPELIFTKAGKILYREKRILTADELSKIMAFFYFGAAKPPCLEGIDRVEETIPTL